MVELTYHKDVEGGAGGDYRIVCKTFRNQALKSWTIFNDQTSQEPVQKFSVYRKANILMINDEVFELSSPGYCREGNDEVGKYRMCITDVQQSVTMSSTVTVDSVYTFDKLYADSSRVQLLISATDNLVLKRVRTSSANAVLEQHTLIQIQRR